MHYLTSRVNIDKNYQKSAVPEGRALEVSGQFYPSRTKIPFTALIPGKIFTG